MARTGDKPQERLRHAKWIAEQVYNAETDPGLRSNLYSAMSLLSGTAIAIDSRERRLMKQAFGPKEVQA